MRTDGFLKPLYTWRAAVASEFGPKSPVARHVLLTLSLHMSEKGDSCFPSIRLLVEETGLTNRTIITHLQESEAAGWIRRWESKDTGQGWKKMNYKAAVPGSVREAIRQAQAAEEAVDNPVDGGQKGGEGGSPPSGNVVNGTQKVVNVTTEGGEGRSLESFNNSTKRTGAAAEPRAARKTQIQEPFQISERVAKWANEKGYITSYLQDCLEGFISNAKAKALRYADWDEAFMTWVRREQQFTRKAPPQKSEQPDFQCCWRDEHGARCTVAKDTLRINAKDFACEPHYRDIYDKEKSNELSKAT